MGAHCLSESDPWSVDETQRLAVLDRLGIVGSAPSSDFDAVLALALQVTGCRAGLIGFMDSDRHWFKAESGVGCPEFARRDSLGNHTLLQTEPLVVEDLTRDARFRDNRLVLERGVRFYAGVALRVDEHKIGTLCLTDRRVREQTPELIEILRHFGHVIESLLNAYAQVARAKALAKTAEEREREIWRQTRLIAQAERLAKVGAWEFVVETGHFVHSAEANRLHELDIDAPTDVADIRSRMSPDFRDASDTAFATCLATGQAYETKGAFVTARGTPRFAQLIAEAEMAEGKVVRVFGTVRDVTTEHLAEQTLWRAANYDALTDAPNRYYWTKRLDEAFVRADADRSSLAILMFDLDGFKEINDTYGHAAGDTVLCEVARRIRENLPEGAFYARLGGDEFAILMQDAESTGAIETIARKLVSAIQAPVIAETFHLSVSGTFGAARFPDDASADDLMRKADIALYQAKRVDRGLFVTFRPVMDDAGLRRKTKRAQKAPDKKAR